MKLAISTLFLLAALHSPAHSQGILYDDFSSGTLDPLKWTERSDTEGNPLVSVYGVSDGVYHTAQPSAANGVIQLEMTHAFQAGEAVEFDATINAAAGNRKIRLNVNNWPTNLGYDSPSCGIGVAIGYWNEPTCVPAALATYHIRVEFNGDGTINAIFEKDGVAYSWNGLLPHPGVIGSPPFFTYETPVTFGVESRSGHNGTFDVDFDNFVIFPAEPVPNGEATWSSIKSRFAHVSKSRN